jgi:hypothetical protein
MILRSVHGISGRNISTYIVMVYGVYVRFSTTLTAWLSSIIHALFKTGIGKRNKARHVQKKPVLVQFPR